MSNTDGHRSRFPAETDDWGDVLLDDACQLIEAEDWNLIQDATLKLERHLAQTVQTGKSGIYNGGSGRKLLVKVYSVSLTGSPTRTKTASLPAFTTAERALFGDTPLAAGNAVDLQVRKLGGDTTAGLAYHGALSAPVSPAGSGAFDVIVTALRHGSTGQTLTSGTYIITLFLSN